MLFFDSRVSYTDFLLKLYIENTRGTTICNILFYNNLEQARRFLEKFWQKNSAKSLQLRKFALPLHSQSGID